MKIFLRLFLIFTIILSFEFALEKGKWKIVKTDEYCYIGSLAISTDLSPEKKEVNIIFLFIKILVIPKQ